VFISEMLRGKKKTLRVLVKLFTPADCNLANYWTRNRQILIRNAIC